MRIDNPMVLSNEDLHNWQGPIDDRFTSEEPDPHRILYALADEIYSLSTKIAEIVPKNNGTALNKAIESLQEAINLIDDYLAKK